MAAVAVGPPLVGNGRAIIHVCVKLQGPEGGGQGRKQQVGRCECRLKKQKKNNKKKRKKFEPKAKGVEVRAKGAHRSA